MMGWCLGVLMRMSLGDSWQSFMQGFVVDIMLLRRKHIKY
jgi:hypothetical protein